MSARVAPVMLYASKVLQLPVVGLMAWQGIPFASKLYREAAAVVVVLFDIHSDSAFQVSAVDDLGSCPAWVSREDSWSNYYPSLRYHDERFPPTPCRRILAHQLQFRNHSEYIFSPLAIRNGKRFRL